MSEQVIKPYRNSTRFGLAILGKKVPLENVHFSARLVIDWRDVSVSMSDVRTSYLLKLTKDMENTTEE